ncbi:MAG TPA: S-methyl-5-thioribose-1-phosphate isomerase [Candidatus Polarisedimenticolia bacterium]|nr:S-methyl-5-thioribose-1-phosphate isomerase [Candidatus Polarisedimenticolia bacterium]
MFSTIDWTDDGVVMLDQRRLPEHEIYVTLRTAEQVAEAIRDMTIRGAPAIGVAAAMGIALGFRDAAGDSPDGRRSRFDSLARLMAATRPTAVNLAWSVDRMRRRFEESAEEPFPRLAADLKEEALRVRDEDIAANRAMGRHGAVLLPDDCRVLTHCNAGALATAGYGTALGVVRAAVEAGKRVAVYADETRPFLQGARLTAWELHRDGIPVTVLTDGMAGHLFQKRTIDVCLVGADRIARNGDTANKIGTYQVAVLARAHGVPFYVAAPTSTIDLQAMTGAEIPIEERSPQEVARIGERRVVPEGVPVIHPAFDVTPHDLIAAIVTERGIVRPPYEAGLAAVCGAGAAREPRSSPRATR